MLLYVRVLKGCSGGGRIHRSVCQIKRLVDWWTVICLLCWLVLGCTTKKDGRDAKSPQSSIYHWKSTADVSTDWYTFYRPHRLYVKYLDLASRKGISVKVTNVKSLPPAAIIPVVFIDSQLLSKHTPDIILQHIERTVPPGLYKEIQIDCDWTLSTKNAYFGLFKRLAKRYQPSARPFVCTNLSPPRRWAYRLSVAVC